MGSHKSQDTSSVKEQLQVVRVKGLREACRLLCVA